MNHNNLLISLKVVILKLKSYFDFQIETGSVAIVLDDPDLKLGIVGWKGKLTVRAYVPRNERLHYLRLIGADTKPYEVNKFQEQKSIANDDEQKSIVNDDEQKIDDEEEEKVDDGEGIKEETINEWIRFWFEIVYLLFYVSGIFEKKYICEAK